MRCWWEVRVSRNSQKVLPWRSRPGACHTVRNDGQVDVGLNAEAIQTSTDVNRDILTNEESFPTWYPSQRFPFIPSLFDWAERL